jgi:polyisoprenoid-binding protein YceI
MARYVVEPGRSRLTVQAFAGGVLSAFGHNPVLSMRDMAGEARFDPDAPDQASIALRVRPSSLEVTGDVKTSDRRDIERAAKEEVLETERFPEIAFASSHVTANKSGDGFFRVEMTGDLQLHGTTQKQTVPAQISLVGDSLRAFGELMLRQTPFGIRLYSAVGGTLKVKDEVKLAFEIVARRQDGDSGG